jgi:hypothetical protein
MLTRLLAVLAIPALMLASWFVVSEPSVSAAQDAGARPIPARADMPHTGRYIRLEPPVDQQMQMREHHARVNMILYTGRLGGSDLATTTRQLDAIALR